MDENHKVVGSTVNTLNYIKQLKEQIKINKNEQPEREKEKKEKITQDRKVKEENELREKIKEYNLKIIEENKKKNLNNPDNDKIAKEILIEAIKNKYKAECEYSDICENIIEHKKSNPVEDETERIGMEILREAIKNKYIAENVYNNIKGKIITTALININSRYTGIKYISKNNVFVYKNADITLDYDQNKLQILPMVLTIFFECENIILSQNNNNSCDLTWEISIDNILLNNFNLNFGGGGKYIEEENIIM